MFPTPEVYPDGGLSTTWFPGLGENRRLARPPGINPDLTGRAVYLKGRTGNNAIMLTTLIIAAPLVILGFLIYAATVEEQRLVDGAEPPDVEDDAAAPVSRRARHGRRRSHAEWRRDRRTIDAA
jgi:hypothetical protein